MKDDPGEFSDIVTLACAASATSTGFVSLVGQHPDLVEVLLLARASAGFFETALGSKYCAGVPLRSSTAEFLGVLCVLDDQSHPPTTAHQQSLLRALGNQAARHIEATELVRHSFRWRALGNVARGIAHDMNNALQTIVGALTTIEKLIEVDNLERTPRFIAAAMRSSKRAAELTGELQRLARREPDGSESIDLNSFIQSTQDILRRLCGEHIAIHFRLTDAAARVDCDPGELFDVLLNIVIDASPGAVTIETGVQGAFASLTVHQTDAATGATVSRSFQHPLSTATTI